MRDGRASARSPPRRSPCSACGRCTSSAACAARCAAAGAGRRREGWTSSAHANDWRSNAHEWPATPAADEDDRDGAAPRPARMLREGRGGASRRRAAARAADRRRRAELRGPNRGSRGSPGSALWLDGRGLLVLTRLADLLAQRGERPLGFAGAVFLPAVDAIPDVLVSRGRRRRLRRRHARRYPVLYVQSRDRAARRRACRSGPRVGRLRGTLTKLEDWIARSRAALDRLRHRQRSAPRTRACLAPARARGLRQQGLDRYARLIWTSRSLRR